MGSHKNNFFRGGFDLQDQPGLYFAVKTRLRKSHEHVPSVQWEEAHEELHKPKSTISSRLRQERADFNRSIRNTRKHSSLFEFEQDVRDLVQSVRTHCEATIMKGLLSDGCAPNEALNEAREDTKVRFHQIDRMLNRLERYASCPATHRAVLEKMNNKVQRIQADLSPGTCAALIR